MWSKPTVSVVWAASGFIDCGPNLVVFNFW